MSAQIHSTATVEFPEAQSGNGKNSLDGGLGQTDPVYAVSNLSSLFTVCALALNGTGEYREDIRERALEDIRLTMVLCSHLAEDAAILVERAISAAKEGGAK